MNEWKPRFVASYEAPMSVSVSVPAPEITPEHGWPFWEQNPGELHLTLDREEARDLVKRLVDWLASDGGPEGRTEWTVVTFANVAIDVNDLEPGE